MLVQVKTLLGLEAYGMSVRARSATDTAAADPLALLLHAMFRGRTGEVQRCAVEGPACMRVRDDALLMDTE